MPNLAFVFDAMAYGVSLNDAALTTLRVVLGVFFWLSGSWKVFCEASHQNMLAEMRDRNIPFPRFNAWFVSAVELAAGLAMIVGALTLFAATALAIVCLVACYTDKQPGGNLLDKIGDYLWKQDVLLAIMLLVIVACGAGPYSVDYHLCQYLRH